MADEPLRCTICHRSLDPSRRMKHRLDGKEVHAFCKISYNRFQAQRRARIAARANGQRAEA